VSARATHLKAATENVFVTTIERKQMSNKTTFKRIALAVVAALGFGVLASAPSSATIQVGATMTATAVNESVKTTETATVNVAFAFSSVGTPASDTIVIAGVKTAGPATGPGAAFVGFRAPTSADSAVSTGLVLSVLNADSSIQAAYNGNTRFVSFTGRFDIITPTVPGTYTYTFYASYPGAAAPAPAAPAPVTYTFTVVGSDRVIASAVSNIAGGVGALANDTPSATDSVVVVSGLVTGTKVANIKVTASNALSETSVTGGFTESITAVITGAGLLAVGDHPGATSSTFSRSVAFNPTSSLLVYSDGTAGVGTITLYKGLTSTVLATETVSFSGNAASATLTLGHTVTSKQASDSQTVLRLVVKDAAGNTLPSGTWYLHSSDTKVISNGTSASACGYTLNTTLGYGACALTVGDTGTTTLKVANFFAGQTLAAGFVQIISNEVELRVVGAAASIAIAFDKTSYAKGEEATLTLTAKDANGFVVPSQSIASLLAAGIDLTPGTDRTDTTVTLTKGVKTFTADAPMVSGSWTAVYKGGTGLPLAGRVTDTITAVVFDLAEEAANSAVDAAQEATDAAIAATDAAILAQEAADEAASAAIAAQETAQAAVDAVTALSAEVTKLVAQLATLQKLLNRVAKRVGVKR
jgi:trimeric autotransporter adhesin